MDISTLTEEKVKDLYENSTLEVKGALSSELTNTILEDIAIKYDLDEHEAEILEHLTTLTLLGLIDRNKFKNELESYVELREDILNYINDAVQEYIFSTAIPSSEISQPYKPISIKRVPMTSSTSIARTGSEGPTSSPLAIPHQPKTPIAETPKTPTPPAPQSIAQQATAPKAAPAPFIIHSHDEEKPKTIGSTTKTPSWSYKPAFIKPEYDSRYKTNAPKPASAKIDLSKTKIPTPTTPQTKQEKFVNYSAPRIVAGEPKASQSNVIDLKDLPK